MENVIVIAEYYSDVSYGVCFRNFIVGSFNSVDEAKKFVEKMKISKELFVFDNDRILIEDNYGYLEQYDIARPIVHDYENRIRCCDMEYFIHILGETPAFIGSAQYIE